jgi:hypothetical protein
VAAKIRQRPRRKLINLFVIPSAVEQPAVDGTDHAAQKYGTPGMTPSKIEAPSGKLPRPESQKLEAENYFAATFTA